MTVQPQQQPGAGAPAPLARRVRVGVLALQGSFREHMALLAKLENVEAVEVRTKEELAGLAGLVIPGGESTTMAHIAERWGLIPELQAFAKAGRPIWGTCAGMIFLAERAEGALGGGAGDWGAPAAGEAAAPRRGLVRRPQLEGGRWRACWALPHGRARSHFCTRGPWACAAGCAERNGPLAVSLSRQAGANAAFSASNQSRPLLHCARCLIRAPPPCPFLRRLAAHPRARPEEGRPGARRRPRRLRLPQLLRCAGQQLRGAAARAARAAARRRAGRIPGGVHPCAGRARGRAWRRGARGVHAHAGGGRQGRRPRERRGRGEAGRAACDRVPPRAYIGPAVVGVPPRARARSSGEGVLSRLGGTVGRSLRSCAMDSFLGPAIVGSQRRALARLAARSSHAPAPPVRACPPPRGAPRPQPLRSAGTRCLWTWCGRRQRSGSSSRTTRSAKRRRSRRRCCGHRRGPRTCPSMARTSSAAHE
jgi:hypothetical protein